MKAQVSIPNPVYKAAEQLAHSLGISLSDLYTAALATYIASHQNGSITEALNRVYEAQSAALDPAFAAIQIASLGEEAW